MTITTDSVQINGGSKPPPYKGIEKISMIVGGGAIDAHFIYGAVVD